MSIVKGKPAAGQGGKRGHSNQDHWEFTEEITEAAKKRPRHQAKKEIVEGLKEAQNEKTRFPVLPLTSDI